MVELKIYLSKDLNDKFRRIAMSIYGYGRGSISKAAEEALAKWCTRHEQPSEHIGGSNQSPNDPTHTDNVEPGINPDERVSVSALPKNGNKSSESVPNNSS